MNISVYGGILRPGQGKETKPLEVTLVSISDIDPEMVPSCLARNLMDTVLGQKLHDKQVVMLQVMTAKPYYDVPREHSLVVAEHIEQCMSSVQAIGLYRSANGDGPANFELLRRVSDFPWEHQVPFSSFAFAH